MPLMDGIYQMGETLACRKEEIILDFLYILFRVTKTHLSRMCLGKLELQVELGKDMVARWWLLFFPNLWKMLCYFLHDF